MKAPGPAEPVTGMARPWPSGVTVAASRWAAWDAAVRGLKYRSLRRLRLQADSDSECRWVRVQGPARVAGPGPGHGHTAPRSRRHWIACVATDAPHRHTAEADNSCGLWLVRRGQRRPAASLAVIASVMSGFFIATLSRRYNCRRFSIRWICKVRYLVCFGRSG